MDSARNITALLAEIRSGNHDCHDRFVAAVYDELKRMAAARLAHEPPGHTLQPSALVNELYLRLMGREQADWQNRAHFFTVAASTMRRILIDHARQRHAVKRGRGWKRLDLDCVPQLGDDQGAERLLALNAALEELATVDPRHIQVVELRFFMGMTNEEAAKVLGLSARTVKREWTMARAWLHSKISGAAV